MGNYLDINKNSWNAKVDTHMKSDFYFIEEFLKGRTSLNSIELELLGNVKDKTILHLQCPFGQDSISLSKMGAKVTGFDYVFTSYGIIGWLPDLNKWAEIISHFLKPTGEICDGRISSCSLDV